MKSERSGEHVPAAAVFMGFALAVRHAGVPVTQDRSRNFLAAVELLGATAGGTRSAGHATLCSSPEDLHRLDQVFDAYFDFTTGVAQPAQELPPQPMSVDLPEGYSDGGSDEADPDPVRALASQQEVLRQRDVATLTPAERAHLANLLASLHPSTPRRRAIRRRGWRRGQVDAKKTLRASMRRMGEPGELHFTRRSHRPRKIVLLIDISGSMTSYADVLLRVAHRYTQAAPGCVETFAIGTRLSHLTRAMRVRDPERALAAAGSVLPDWSGGTRLGENLAAFMRRWGRRGLARGAVVVIFSDGWERGDSRLLGEQTEQLQRVAHKTIWVNPHRGKPGYEPLQTGVLAVLPHVDHFVAGHSVATYAELMDLVAHS